MSTANAIKVMVAARNDKSDDTSVTVTWVEKDRRRAMKVTAVAESREEG